MSGKFKCSERPKKRQILPGGVYASSSFDAGDVAGGDNTFFFLFFFF